MSTLSLSSTLAEAKDWLKRELWTGKTATCPTCKRIAKIYPYKIDSAMARTAVLMLRKSHGDFIHVARTLPGDNHKVSQLRFWGLVEELQEKREDGGRAGYWRLTPEGEAFASGEAMVSERAHVYDAKVLGYSGPPTSIFDALGDRFSYSDLMQTPL